MMATCNGHYLSFFWCHTLVNKMQLGLHWCVALAARRATAKRFCDSSDPASWAVRLWCSIRICWAAASAMNSFIPLSLAPPLKQATRGPISRVAYHWFKQSQQQLSQHPASADRTTPPEEPHPSSGRRRSPPSPEILLPTAPNHPA